MTNDRATKICLKKKATLFKRVGCLQILKICRQCSRVTWRWLAGLRVCGGNAVLNQQPETYLGGDTNPQPPTPDPNHNSFDEAAAWIMFLISVKVSFPVSTYHRPELRATRLLYLRARDAETEGSLWLSAKVFGADLFWL